jgi:DNA polymerase V
MNRNILKSQTLSICKVSIGTPLPLPFFLSKVQAGFPSPADDYIEKQLDLNELVIKHPSATFFVKVEGDSMCDAGILSGDVLVVDRSIEPSNGKIVVAVLNGEFTVKRIQIAAKGICLLPANAAFPVIEVSSESDFQVWGVVTYIIHKA